MPETEPIVEYSHKVLEDGEEQAAQIRRRGWIEILEVAVVAIVALSTAWSGFEAAKWSGLSARQYALGLLTIMRAEEKATSAGQDRLYDVFAFNDWLEAKLERKDRLASFFERRFRPEYAGTFHLWQQLDPFHNPSAPPGPSFMQEYVNANSQESARLDAEGERYFQEGERMRETGDEYIRVTIFLATVLLLVAISQRIRMRRLRIGLVTLAFVLLCSSGYYLLTLPRVW